MPRCQRRKCITAPTGPREATATESTVQDAEGSRNGIVDEKKMVELMRREEVRSGRGDAADEQRSKCSND